MLRNRLLPGLVIAAAVAAPAATAAPQKHLSVSPTTAAPGALVHVSGNASPCLRGSTLTAISGAFPGHAFGEGTLTGTVGHAGRFAFSGHLRAHLHAGRYAVTARCGGGTLGIVAYLHIR